MKAITLLITCFLGALATSGPAYAYLDPNSGSLILQILLGGFAGIAVVLRVFWGNFISLFRFSFMKSDAKKSDDEQ